MKLTDEQIDTLFQESAAKQSFVYKPEYWEEFATSLSGGAPLSEASDDAFDNAFQTEATKQSFDYKPEFWDEFSASLPDNAPLSQAPDETFDAAFQNDASSISVDYKPEFWNEFSDELPLMMATENVSDAEVDAMYREEASKLSFVYNPAYWEEMAAMLRRRRRRPEFLWFGLSGIFTSAIIAMFFVQQSSLEIVTPTLSFNGILTENSTSSPYTATTNNSETSGSDFMANNVNNSEFSQNTIGATNETQSASGSNRNNLDQRVNPLRNDPQRNLPSNVINGTRKINPITPKFLVTATYIAPNQLPLRSTTIEANDAINMNPMNSKSLSLIRSEIGQLEDVFAEMPVLKPYKGGWQSSLYIQGIGGISESLITPSESLAGSFGIGAGFTIGKGNWTANLGSNVLIEKFNDLHLTRTGKSYVDFSSEQNREDYQFKNFYTLELDLGLGYNFGRHQVRLGVRPSYTYNARVDYSQVSIFNDQGEMVETSENRKGEYGYLDALQLWGIKPTVGYAYNFPSNWTLGFNIGTELRPSINEDFISGVNNNLPIDGQLYLRKTLKSTK